MASIYTIISSAIQPAIRRSALRKLETEINKKKILQMSKQWLEQKCGKNLISSGGVFQIW